MPENSQPDNGATAEEHHEDERPNDDQPQSDQPDTGQPDHAQLEDPERDTSEGADQDPGEGPSDAAEAPESQTATEAPGARETAAGDVSTTYERTAQGHRITRRTVHRSEVSEDTRETIEETFPVTPAPMPYAPPTSDHPNPVG
jgi:hypothetical protein